MWKSNLFCVVNILSKGYKNIEYSGTILISILSIVNLRLAH